MNRTKTSQRSATRILAAAWGVACICGCGESPSGADASLRSFDRRGPRQRPTSEFSAIAEDERKESISLVQQTLVSPEGADTYADWVRDQTESIRGTVLFPNWRAHRIGAGRYIVKFEYTAIDEDSLITPRGHAWIVDLSLKSVTAPRELAPEELGQRRRPARPPSLSDPRTIRAPEGN